MKLVWKVTSDKAQIDAMNKSIGVSIKQLTDRLHIVTCSTLLHVVEHGNSTPLNDTFKAVGQGRGNVVRTNAMKQFVAEFPAVTYDEESDSFSVNKEGAKAERAKFKAAPEEYVKALTATPWNEAKPEPKFKPMNLPQELVRCLKKLDSQQKAHPDDERIVAPVEMVNTIRRLVAAA